MMKENEKCTSKGVSIFMNSIILDSMNLSTVLTLIYFRYKNVLYI